MQELEPILHIVKGGVLVRWPVYHRANTCLHIQANTVKLELTVFHFHQIHHNSVLCCFAETGILRRHLFVTMGIYGDVVHIPPQSWRPGSRTSVKSTIIGCVKWSCTPALSFLNKTINTSAISLSLPLYHTHRQKNI